VSGTSTDLETLFVSKKLANLSGSNSLYAENGFHSNNLDFVSSNTMSLDLPAVESNDLCILINVNPRHEMPLLNTRLRKQVMANNMKVVYFGDAMSLTFPSTHLGVSGSSILSFIKGNHPFCSEVFKAKNPLFILGNGSCNLDFKGLETVLKSNLKLNVKDASFHVLTRNLSSIGASYMGLPKYTPTSFNQTDLLLLLNTNNFDFSLINKDCTVIYIGTHGNADAVESDAILPGVAFSEKKSSFYNVTGKMQKTFRALHGPGSSRDDWKIFGALACFLGHTLPFKDFKTLHGFANNSLYSDSYTTFFNIENALKNVQFLRDTFTNKGLLNFYISDQITGNSKVMNLCSANRQRINYN
jgi:NADH dehydrogenase (ubiquinone) Fe-S protein 1